MHSLFSHVAILQLYYYIIIVVLAVCLVVLIYLEKGFYVKIMCLVLFFIV